MASSLQPWMFYGSCALWAASLLGLSGATVRAAIFDLDDRVQVEPLARSPYAPIGRVHSAETGSATGFLLSECHVLTVQHAVSRTVHRQGKRVQFRAVMTGNGRSPRESGGTVIAAGGPAESDVAKHPLVGRSSDWALSRLDRCLGSKEGYVEFAQKVGSEYGKVLRSAGFPRDRQSVVDALIFEPILPGPRVSSCRDSRRFAPGPNHPARSREPTNRA